MNPVEQITSRSCPWPRASWQLLLPVLLLVFWLPTDRAIAQHGPGGFENAAQYIERTEEILLHIAETVLESESVRARRILGEARQLHLASYRQLDAGRPLMAVNLSHKARQAGQHAAQVAREELGFEHRALLYLERLRHRYEMALDRAQEMHNERALRFLQEAERQYHRAHEQYAQHNFEIAFNLLKSAETLLGRAERLLFEAGDIELVARELERTQLMIERTDEQVGLEGDQMARDLLVRAERILSDAREALARGEPRRALQLARQARRLAGEAAALAGGGVQGDAVRGQIERWDERQAVVAEMIQETGNRQARLLLERALQHRRTAEDRLAAGNPEQALRQIKIAHDLLHEAGELVR